MTDPKELVTRLRDRTVTELPEDWKKGRKCPDCGAAANRPKCAWDKGGACPRHEPENYDPNPYVEVPDPLCVEAADYIERASAENKRLRDALDQSRIALDDWVNTYAPEFCDAARVEEARARIRQHGTLGYVATVQEQNRRALENSHE